MHLSVRPPDHASLYKRFVFLSACLCFLSVYLSICLSVCLSVCRALHAEFRHLFVALDLPLRLVFLLPAKVVQAPVFHVDGSLCVCMYAHAHA
jgi:hypothetical protein